MNYNYKTSIEDEVACNTRVSNNIAERLEILSKALNVECETLYVEQHDTIEDTISAIDSQITNSMRISRLIREKLSTPTTVSS